MINQKASHYSNVVGRFFNNKYLFLESGGNRAQAVNHRCPVIVANSPQIEKEIPPCDAPNYRYRLASQSRFKFSGRTAGGADRHKPRRELSQRKRAAAYLGNPRYKLDSNWLRKLAPQAADNLLPLLF